LSGGEMMKAKLIIDMPEKCDHCRFFCQFEDGEDFCCALSFLKYFTDDEIDYVGSKRADWCPLEEMPE
jgi:hypothetical protein